MDNEALEQVIAKAGGPSALAKKLGVTSQAVSQWKSVPARHAAIVADILDCPVRTLLSARRTPTEARP
ncbi:MULTISPECIES: helix-turn-helix domain-containing protein [Asaia]|uniref:Helix-turn-helix domain-containing protein n=2 Tax=Asaia TaxID=91914 RepID=A0ABX2P6L9_9PROT|nr:MULTISPECIES: helix-turn-helix domain-containing protein [Asaia]GBQ89091.1 hypothetical protein AA0535_1709 [Asaia krungthepensis NRIC 0535]GBR19757.1 hypothetical protein AA105894_2390 [Asaia spathodeae NBRC 105894]